MSDVLDGGGVEDPTLTPSTELRHGVTVQHVRDLATHVGRTTASTDTAFGSLRPEAVNDHKIAHWINLVADSVDARMLALTRWSADTTRWAGILGSARTAITNGAAAYLVAAHFPAKAGTNEQTGLSAELNARYERELEFLTVLPEVLAKDDEATGDGPVPASARVPIRASYRPPAVPNDSSLFFHTRPMAGAPNQDVYRRSPAPGAEYPYR